MRENMQRFLNFSWHGSGVYRHFSETIWPPLKKAPSRTTVLFIFVLFLGAFITARWIDSSIAGSSSNGILQNKNKAPKFSNRPPKRVEIPLNCSAGNLTRTCPVHYPVKLETGEDESSSTSVCPDYFRWIHEDLRPWRDTGITMEMVERAQRTATFRLVIVKGRVYVERYRRAFQTRDVFTLWGILQLLRRYPGRLPDLDLMFDCVDWPVVFARDYRGPNAMAPPPLFRYCADHLTLDIVFPDWSFWGWAEINIKPWDSLLVELKEGNKRTKWVEREPYAYWKGNPVVAVSRQDLLKCNVSDTQDWNARVYAQAIDHWMKEIHTPRGNNCADLLNPTVNGLNGTYFCPVICGHGPLFFNFDTRISVLLDWISESRKGYKQSNLADQCINRYKIYIEGSAWSVSEKYILACDSVTFIVKPQYYDFFTRSLVATQHYWPIQDNDKCRSIKFAVDWGNNHQQKAQDIGKAASNFIQEDLKMDYVYDYMFHLLNEYAKLLRYKPTIPRKAREFCSETMACPADGLVKKFMMESRVKAPSDTGPCTILPPFDPPALEAFLKKKADSIKQVEMWEKEYWRNHTK